MLRPFILLLLLAAPAAAQDRVTLPERDRTLRGTPATVLTIGREEGESWQLFSNVSGVDFDARDNVYILDAGNHRVVVVDPRGRLVRIIGRQGGGPGELLAPSALAVLEDGAVAVADLGRGAFSIFDSDGAFRYNLPFTDSLGHPGPEQRGATPSLQPHPNGLAVFGALRIAEGRPAAAPSAAPDAVPVYVRPLAERAAPRVLQRIPRQPPRLRTEGGESDRRVRTVPRLLSPQPAWAVLADGGIAALHGTTPEYRIHITDATGRVVRVLERPLEPRRVTRADQERAREQLAERMRSGVGMVRVEVRSGTGGTQRSVSTGGGGDRGPGEAEIRAQLQNVEFGERVPVVTGLRSDARGRIWVGRAAARVGEDGPIDLLGADGRYHGTLAPQPLPDAFSRSGLTAYITTSELGAEQVQVRRLPAGAR